MRRDPKAIAMRRTAAALTAVLIAVGLPAVGAAAQDAHELAITPADREFEVRVVLAAVAPTIDGSLDDAVWQGAPQITELTQSQPDEGAPATERSEIWIAFDSEALYVAARLYDRRPDQMVATVLRRDESHSVNDAFAITLDTYHDHRNGFLFETNALGAKYDAQIIGEGGATIGRGQTFNEDWDAVWYAAGSRDDEGWTVEIAIPLWSLRFEQVDAWGVNFRRTIRRKAEQSYWAPVPRQFNATRLSLSGMLLGLESDARPRNVQVKPYLRGDVGQFPDGPASMPYEAHRTELSGTAGGDIKWAITPNMTLDGTVNTDFAQVEADDVQINLTRFPLFFPEKREFFLENAGLFEFGGGGRGVPQVVGFFSRRIGIDSGQEVPILGGARLTGKVDRWNIGLVNMQTESVDDLGLPSENHGVARVRYDLGSRSSIGTLFTNRQSGGDAYNRSFGFDGRWAINEATTIDGWWMATRDPDATGESDWAGQVQAQYATPSLQIDGSAMQIGDAFDPGLGFVDRRDVRAYATSTVWTPYFPDSPWVRNLSPHANLNYISDREGRLLSRRLHLDFDMYLRRGDKLSLAHNRNFEQLDEPFQIVPGVVIVPGAYHFDELQLELQSDTSRIAWAGLMYTWGGFWDGNRKQISANAGFRVGAHFSATANYDRNDVDLTGGSFVTDLWRMRLTLDVSTKLFIAGLFQYDSLTDQFQSNVRFHYLYSPLSDIFLVYNERRLTEDPTLIDRAVILKLTKLFRL